MLAVQLKVASNKTIVYKSALMSFGKRQSNVFGKHNQAFTARNHHDFLATLPERQHCLLYSYPWAACLGVSCFL